MVFPAPGPTVDGTRVTVDMYLQRPIEVLNDITSDIALEQFFAEELFTPGDDAPSGAVVYNEVMSQLYPDRDVARATAGGQFPVIVTTNPELKTAYAEEHGGKYYLTYPAIRRNRINEFDRNNRLLRNALIRKWNGIAVALLEATITAVGATAQVAGSDWSGAGDPWVDFMTAQAAADQRELGIEIDTVMVDPTNWLHLVTNPNFRELFTPETRERIAREGVGINTLQLAGMTIRKSHAKTAGTALAVASGEVGGRHREAPAAGEGDDIAYDASTGIAMQVWDDPSNRRKWVQGWKSEVLYVDNPLAVYEITGI